MAIYVPALAAVPKGAGRAAIEFKPEAAWPSVERTVASKKAGLERWGAGARASRPAPVQLASWQSGGGTAPASAPPLDHFQCYRTSGFCAEDAHTHAGAAWESESQCGDAEDETDFWKPQDFSDLQVRLRDRFETGFFDVGKPIGLCNPADVNGEGIEDTETHLRSYRIWASHTDRSRASHTDRPPHGHTKRRDIRIENQFHPRFGKLTVDIIKADRLLVPSAKSLSGPVDPPDPASHAVDHYKCYQVVPSHGASDFPRHLRASVVDQFGQPKVFEVMKPGRLCVAADKNGEGIKNPAAHLMCYPVKPVAGFCDRGAKANRGRVCEKETDCGGKNGKTRYCTAQPKHVKVSGIYTHNQFGQEKFDTIREEELCVPSRLPDDEKDRDRDGFTVSEGDCDDEDPAVHPGAAEVCNAKDDDCDGEVDGADACAAPTATVTPKPTATVKPTVVVNPTATVQPTATPTTTPTSTETPTPTATVPPTASPTTTRSSTETPTPTATVPPTASPTTTPTSTETPTPTATVQPTASPTTTPTSTETPTPTATVQPTATLTASPTSTQTATPTTTVEPTVVVNATATLEPTATLTAAPACMEAPSGLVAWLPGDGNTNEIQARQDGIAQNGASFAPAMAGQGFSLNGVDQYVRVPDKANQYPGAGSFTVDAWIETSTTGGTQMVVSKDECGDDTCFPGDTSLYQLYVDSSGHAAADVHDGDIAVGLTITGTTVVTDGAFHHLAMARDIAAGELRLYVDGALEARSALNAGSDGTINNDDLRPHDLLIGARFRAGRTDLEGFFSGLIDEVQLVDRALGDTEVDTIFDAGSDGQCKAGRATPGCAEGHCLRDGLPRNLQQRAHDLPDRLFRPHRLRGRQGAGRGGLRQRHGRRLRWRDRRGELPDRWPAHCAGRRLRRARRRNVERVRSRRARQRQRSRSRRHDRAACPRTHGRHAVVQPRWIVRLHTGPRQQRECQ